MDRAIKKARDALDQHRRTIEILEAINPTRPEDASEHGRQIRNARVLETILHQFTIELEHLKASTE